MAQKFLLVGCGGLAYLGLRPFLVFTFDLEETKLWSKWAKSYYNIATLGSILNCQLSWESGKLKLTRWSHRVALFSGLDHPPTAKLFFVNVVQCLHPNKVCAVSPPPSICFLSMLCGVPTRFVPLIKKVCAVSPSSSTNISSVSPPPHSNVILCLCHTWLCLGF